MDNYLTTVLWDRLQVIIAYFGSWHRFISPDSTCWRWQLKSDVDFNVPDPNNRPLAVCDVLSLTVFERHLNVLLWSLSGVRLWKKQYCLFRQKQGVPSKSAWRHCTRTRFNKLHKQLPPRFFSFASHIREILLPWKTGLVILVTLQKCYCYSLYWLWKIYKPNLCQHWRMKFYN